MIEVLIFLNLFSISTNLIALLVMYLLHRKAQSPKRLFSAKPTEAQIKEISERLNNLGVRT